MMYPMGNINKQWLLKAFPRPTFVPSRLDIVIHKETGRRALVLTEPADPEEVDELPVDQETRPCVCDVLVGEELHAAVDVSQLQPVS